MLAPSLTTDRLTDGHNRKKRLPLSTSLRGLMDLHADDDITSGGLQMCPMPSTQRVAFAVTRGVLRQQSGKDVMTPIHHDDDDDEG